MNKAQIEMDRLMFEEELKLINQLSNEPMSLRQIGRAIKLDALIRGNRRNNFYN
ncbi:MAG: hypothetical protein FWD06_02135 [Oscillospiraceae bacterium]|nr:hypothetical protein [Oscillospiraceae bacterium]